MKVKLLQHLVYGDPRRHGRAGEVIEHAKGAELVARGVAVRVAQADAPSPTAPLAGGEGEGRLEAGGPTVADGDSRAPKAEAPGGKPTCPVCGRVCANKGALATHMGKAHPAPRASDDGADVGDGVDPALLGG